MEKPLEAAVIDNNESILSDFKTILIYKPKKLHEFLFPATDM